MFLPLGVMLPTKQNVCPSRKKAIKNKFQEGGRRRWLDIAHLLIGLQK
jgi:hypothetical protein